MTATLKSQDVRLEFGWAATPAGQILDVSAWTDVSTDIREAPSVVPTRGRTNEQDTAKSEIAFVLSNPSGRYTPGYQPGSNWPNVVRGTPVRWSQRAPSGSGSYVVRWVGYIDSIEPDWSDPAATDAVVAITAVGRMQIISSASPLGTTMDVVARFSNPTHYYALDEADTATAFLDSSAYGRAPLAIPSSWTPGQSADNHPVGVAFAPSIDVYQKTPLQVSLNGHRPGTASGISMAFQMATNIGVNGVWPVIVTDSTGSQWKVTTIDIDGSGLKLTVTNPGTGYSYASGELASWLLTFPGPTWHTILLVVHAGTSTSSAATVDLYVDSTQYLTLQPIAWVGADPGVYPAPTWTSLLLDERQDAQSMAHVAAYGNVASVTSANLGRALYGLDGQQITDRVTALYGHAPLTPTTALPTTSLDPVDTTGQNLMDPLQAAVTTTGGYFVDTLDGVTSDLRWVGAEERANPSVWMALDIANGDVLDFPPTFDTQWLSNDVTVASPDGDARVSDITSIGVNGAFSASFTVAGGIEDARRLAQWTLGSRKDVKVRFPSLTIDLENHSSLATTWLSGDPIGKLVSVANTPAMGTVYVFIEGYTETIRYGVWTVQINCSPADPWTRCLKIADSTLGRIGLDGHTTSTGALTGTGTGATLLVTPTGGRLLTTAVGDYPMSLNVGGESVTISACSGVASPQTLTVSARGTNGTTAKAHTAGSAVDLWTPPVISLGRSAALTDVYADTYANAY